MIVGLASRFSGLCRVGSALSCGTSLICRLTYYAESIQKAGRRLSVFKAQAVRNKPATCYLFSQNITSPPSLFCNVAT